MPRGCAAGIVDILHGSRSTAAAPSLAGVRTVRRRPVFMCVVRITLLSHGDAAPVAETHQRLDAAVPARLLEVPRVEDMSVTHSCALS
jgi:hypothetical protein